MTIIGPSQPARSGEHWGIFEDDWVRRLTAQGKTAEEIATALERTEGAIKSRQMKLGLIPSPFPPEAPRSRHGATWTDEERERLLKLVEMGLAWTDIGRILGRTRLSVQIEFVRLQRGQAAADLFAKNYYRSRS